MDIQAFNILDTLKVFLKSKNFKTFTPVQDKTIPLLLKGKSVLVKAPTGSGKTFSFLLPIITNIDFNLDKTQYIIFVPTRELGIQIKKEITKINEFLDQELKTQLLIGGSEKNEEMKKYGKSHIIVATPSRITEIHKLKPTSLSEVKGIIIDEVDMVVDFGSFEELFDFYQKNLKKTISVSIFSATLNQEIKKMVSKTFTNIFTEVNVNLEKPITNYYIKTDDRSKFLVLEKLLNSDFINPYLAIIFVNKNDEVYKVFKFLEKEGFMNVAFFNKELSQRERKRLLKNLNNDKIVYLVTTDLMARGIDLLNITHVINFDLPFDNNYYMHRIGRTNRSFNKQGQIYSLVNEKELQKLHNIADKNKINLVKKRV